MLQRVSFPEMLVGVEGVLCGVTTNVEAPLVPQIFVAVTDTVPAVVFGTTLTVLVVDVPVKPAGNVQLYVFPATALTE